MADLLTYVRGYIRPRKRLDGDTELIREHREGKLEIDAEICMPLWERNMDIDMALDEVLAGDGVLEIPAAASGWSIRGLR